MSANTLKNQYDCETLHPGENHQGHQQSWTEHLMDTVKIISHTKGRIRFHLGFEGDEILNDAIRREASKKTGIQFRYYNYQTNNVLYYYDDDISASDVALCLLSSIVEFAKRHGECEIGDDHSHEQEIHAHHKHDHDDHEHTHAHDDGAACGHGDEDDDCGHDHGNLQTQKQFNREIVKLSLTGIALGYFIWRRMRKGTPALASGPIGWVSAIATITAGYPIFKGGIKSVQPNQKINDDTLISIAIAATLIMRENITGLSVVWLINLGRFLEAMTLKKSRDEIKALLDLAPDEAWLVMPNGKIEKQPVKTIEKNEIIRVFKGDRIALDGFIESGTASIIDSHLSGEPLPKSSSIGMKVFAGTIVEDGQIDIKVENLVTETAIAKVVTEVQKLKRTKAPIDRFGQQFASKFVPISLGIAGGVYFFTRDWQRAITSLVIACPCAAGLATPTAVSAGIGKAAKKGILVKGGLHLENASKANVFVFDKTGTLTVGFPQLTQVECFHKDYSEEELLFVAASIEKYSQHPLAKVIVQTAESQNMNLHEVEAFKINAGKGVEGIIDHEQYFIGNFKYIGAYANNKKVKPSAKALTEVYIAHSDKGIIGRLSFQDELRPGSKRVIATLKELGHEVVLLSGDRQNVVDQVAKELSIDVAIGDAMPDDKASFIQRRQSQGKIVAMIGEGVNDAQALAGADVSIAIAAGQCDIAVDTADITIAGDHIEKVLDTLHLSNQTIRTIKQNFVASIGVNMIGLGLGAGGKLSPFMAAIVHNLSTIAVVVNSMSLSKKKV